MQISMNCVLILNFEQYEVTILTMGTLKIPMDLHVNKLNCFLPLHNCHAGTFIQPSIRL